MMTSTPPLLYWEPITVAIMLAVRRWRAEWRFYEGSLPVWPCHHRTPGQTSNPARHQAGARRPTQRRRSSGACTRIWTANDTNTSATFVVAAARGAAA